MSVLCDFYSSPWFSPAFFAERFNESLFQKAAAEVVPHDIENTEGRFRGLPCFEEWQLCTAYGKSGKETSFICPELRGK